MTISKVLPADTELKIQLANLRAELESLSMSREMRNRIRRRMVLIASALDGNVIARTLTKEEIDADIAKVIGKRHL